MFWAIVKIAVCAGLLAGMWRAFMRSDGKALGWWAAALGAGLFLFVCM